MTDDASEWLASLRPQLGQALLRAAADRPANVALMHILMEAKSLGEAEQALDAAIAESGRGGDPRGFARLGAVRDLLRANPQGFDVVHGILGGLDHAHEPRRGDIDQLRYWSEAFDAAARRHPEASVALYGLGSPDLMRAATAEIVDRLAEWGLLSPDAECLDLGCGIGRLETELAGQLRRIVGVDISGEMVAEARRRTAALPNVEVRQIGGRDLAGCRDEAFDLVLAVDTFPYLVGAGGDLAGAMIGEVARVLKPRGRLVILNYSYRGDPEADRSEVGRLAAGAGLDIVRIGTGDFTLWDAVTFDLRKH